MQGLQKWNQNVNAPCWQKYNSVRTKSTASPSSTIWHWNIRILRLTRSRFYHSFAKKRQAAKKPVKIRLRNVCHVKGISLTSLKAKFLEYPPVHSILLNSVLHFLTCDKIFNFLTRIFFFDKITFQCFHSLRFKITGLKFRRTRTSSILSLKTNICYWNFTSHGKLRIANCPVARLQ